MKEAVTKVRSIIIIDAFLIILKFTERELAVEEGQHKSLPNGLNARHFHLTAAIGLLSLSVDVSVEPVRVTRRQVGDTQGEECLIVLFGESLEQAVVSESIM